MPLALPRIDDEWGEYSGLHVVMSRSTATEAGPGYTTPSSSLTALHTTSTALNIVSSDRVIVRGHLRDCQRMRLSTNPSPNWMSIGIRYSIGRSTCHVVQTSIDCPAQ